MKKTIIIFTVLSIILVNVFLITPIKAETAATTDTQGQYKYTCSIDGKAWTSLADCQGNCKTTDTSGLQGLCTGGLVIGPAYITSMIKKYTQWFMAIVASIAVLMIIWGGLKYMTAKGDPEKAGKARTLILYALIGLAITLVAGGAMWTILNFIQITP